MQDLQASQPVNQKDIYQNAIKISYRLEAEMLFVFVTGKRSFEDSHYFWEKIVQICEQNDTTNVQLTLALRGKYSTFDSIKNYQQIIHLVRPYEINVAIIDLNGLSKNDTQVACNMAASQGLNCSYFNQESDAIKWLEQFTLESAL